MKKYLRFAMYMFMTVFCLTFVSCSSDDDDNKNINYLPNGGVENYSYLLDGTIEINGVNYSLSTEFISNYLTKHWRNTNEEDGENGEDDKNKFAIIFLNKHVGNTCYWKEEIFYFKLPETLSLEDYVTKEIDLPVILIKHEPNDDYSSGEFMPTNDSGPAKIVGIDIDKSRMTIEFENVKTTNGDFTYTFNGKANVPFIYQKSIAN